MTIPVITGLVVIAVGLKLCWRELFNVGPAVLDAGSSRCDASTSGASGGASLYTTLNAAILVTGLDVELDMRNSVVPLEEVLDYVTWVERLPEVAA